MDLKKPAKMQLNPLIIDDIVRYVAKRCRVSETAVRSSITTKCADENKMLRQRQQKGQGKTRVDNKENVDNNRQETN